jgi:hypothetical protein
MRLVLHIITMPDSAANMNRRDLPVTILPGERDFRNPQNRAIIRFTLSMAIPFWHPRRLAQAEAEQRSLA